MWYAKRLSDGKEFLATSIYVYKNNGSSGINGVSFDGEKAELEDGTFELYRK